jgi:hypothetical protein
MHLKCSCGSNLTDGASPNDIQHLLISDASIETLQNAVDAEVRRHCEIDEWPEHWEASGAVEAWMCPNCKRIYVNPRAAPQAITVYAIERKGI